MSRRTGYLLAVVLIAVLAAAPLWAAQFTITLLNYIGIYALVVLGIVLLTGVGGLTSFGQAAFVGIGAYATAWLTTAHGASPWLGLLFALAVTGAVAALLGAVTLRLGGHFLPLGTIAWGLSIYFCSAISTRSAVTTASPTCRRSRSARSRSSRTRRSII